MVIRENDEKRRKITKLGGFNSTVIKRNTVNPYHSF